MRRSVRFAGVVAALVVGMVQIAPAAQSRVFEIVRSKTAVDGNCLPNAAGTATINTLGAVENLHVEVTGLPPNADFDFFVIQVPDAPFGLSWYQGDIETNAAGRGVGDFTGRFSIETFIVAPGAAPVPSPVHDGDQPDGNNPVIAKPIHTFHVGLWFNSATDAENAGCPGNVTPFNGDHTAGVQAMSTRNFAANAGPLKKLH